MSARRAKCLSVKGLSKVVHRLAPKACTDAVENWAAGDDDVFAAFVVIE
jgi:hypothetical protein